MALFLKSSKKFQNFYVNKKGEELYKNKNKL